MPTKKYRSSTGYYNQEERGFDIVTNVGNSRMISKKCYSNTQTVQTDTSTHTNIYMNSTHEHQHINEPTEINLDELKDFITDKINQVIVAVQPAPVELIESLYSDVIQPFNENGPCSLPGIERLTELYNSFNSIIEATDDCVDTRLLVYRDILQLLPPIKSQYVENIIAEKKVCELYEKNKELRLQIQHLIHRLHACEGTGDMDIITGKLVFTLLKPKPLIYVQAIFNIKLAWYYYLHGNVVKPKEYEATIEYVNSLGTKQEAYDKLIVLLDEKYRDENEEFQKLLAGGSSSNDNSSGSLPETGSSGLETSSNSSGNCNTSSSEGGSAVGSCNLNVEELCASSDSDSSDYSSSDDSSDSDDDY